MKKHNIAKTIIIVGSLLYLVLGYYFFQDTKASNPRKTIAVILPMEHQALTDIYEGFKEEITKSYEGDVKVDLYNAGGDLSLERAMINQAIRDKVDIIVPVGTKTTQMTASLAKNQNIVFLAANVQSSSDLAKKNSHLTGVIDEIPAEKTLAFITASFPKVQKIAVVHSACDKVHKDYLTFLAKAKDYKIKVQPYMVQNLSELYQVGQSFDKDCDLIFVFKDHLIASGIETLVNESHKYRIPLVTSDEGTVSKGALVSLGVREKNIGRFGAKMAHKILNGVPVSQISIEYMSEATVFLNEASCNKQKLETSKLKQVAKSLGYGHMMFSKSVGVSS